MSAKAGSHQPVIIIKKQAHGKHGHHGGAWKVAYADFVTAMMAFFLVMWIVAQSAEVKQGIAGYFRDPNAMGEGGNGILPGAASGMEDGGASVSFPGDVEEAEQMLEQAANQLRAKLAALPDFEAIADRVEIGVTQEGLRIELREAPDEGFFDSGSATIKPEAVALLHIIGDQLRELPNHVAVEGHTDSLPYRSGDPYYTNWELSADRANAARRVLEEAGLAGEQIEGVRGFADRRLRLPDDPMDPGNRRISIVVRRG